MRGRWPSVSSRWIPWFITVCRRAAAGRAVEAQPGGVLAVHQAAECLALASITILLICSTVEALAVSMQRL